MDQFEFVHNENVKRYRNLLETSVDETERRTILELLAKEQAKQTLQASEPNFEVSGLHPERICRLALGLCVIEWAPLRSIQTSSGR
jgi:hypothetical protein